MHLGATQFEADAARRAFPCFDEPGMKAKYNFTFVTPSDAVALFNTAEDPSKAVDLGGGFTSHSYALTPPMSSYLVAFVVGRLQSVSIITQGQPRNISVWGRPER
jgi:puromycin-sensitive aminopeptidase